MNRKQYFNMHAAKWDTYVKKEILRRIEKKVMPLLEIKKSETILDVGSGTGIMLPFLKKAAGTNSRITALDYTAKMIDRAEKKYGDDFTYVRANASHTRLPNNSYDKIICFSVFPHFPRKLIILREMRRLLKNNGILIIAHADSRETINAFHKKTGAAVMHDHMPGDSTMKALLTKARFRDVRIQEGKDYYVIRAVKPHEGGSGL